MLTVDARCPHRLCEAKNIYRMVGSCSNCGTSDVLMLFTASHDSNSPEVCPTCECRTLRAKRLATDEEIPVA